MADIGSRHIPVRPLTDDDIRPLLGVMSRAFFSDPCFEWVFRDDHARLDDLVLLFETAAAVLVPHGLSVTTEDRAGLSLWAPPGMHRAEESVTAAYGERMAARYATETMSRLMQFFALTDEHHPEEPHYYLGVLAADAGRQGQGLGSACMSTVLRRVDAEGAPAYLESSNEKNVPLYERHGFAVTNVVDLPGGGPPVYFMWRSPG